MYRCPSCGNEFATTQALGSHQRYRCGSPSAIVQQAQDVLQAAQGGHQSLTRVPESQSTLRVSKQARNQDSQSLRVPSEYQSLEYNLPSDQKSLAELKQELAEAKVRADLSKQLGHVRGRQLRRMAVVLLLTGAACWFLGHGKLRLPFFGDVDS